MYMQIDQVEGLVSAVSEAALIANQYMAGFMAVIVLLMIAAGLIIAVIISRAVSKIIDSNAKDQNADNSLQSQILNNWAQDRTDYREVAQSVRDLTASITPIVTTFPEMTRAIALSSKQQLDSNEATAATVAEFSLKLGDLIKQAERCENEKDEIIAAINEARDRIIELFPSPPPTPTAATEPPAPAVTNADGAEHNAMVDSREDAA
jgi:uncharacterized membrane protein YraQ (UPF0718 family)